MVGIQSNAMLLTRDRARSLVSELLATYKKLAETSDNPESKNAYGWLALTCEPVELRDPVSALRFAIDANKLTGFEIPSYLDTLSLAYHLTGNTPKAIETQNQAIALLPEGDSALRKGLEEALAKFEAAQDEGR